MATLANALTLSEKLSLMEPRSKKLLSSYVELLDRDTSILDLIPTMEANNITSHEYRQVVGLPTVAARLAGEGTAASKSDSVAQVAHIKIYSSLMKIDKDTYELGGQGKEYVAQEARRHMSALDIKLAEDLFYGSTTDIKRMSGMSNTYNSLTGNIGNNVISAGSVSGGDAMSIWVCGLGGNGLNFIYPTGSPSAGFKRTSSGEWNPVTDSNNKTRFEMTAEFVCNRGYVIPDWRSQIRICNIDKSALLADPTGATISLPSLLMRASSRKPSKQLVQVKDYQIFMGRTCYEMLQTQLYNKSNGAFSYREINGQQVPYFDGMKINILDALVANETTVS
jgi:hypothetical protein